MFIAIGYPATPHLFSFIQIYHETIKNFFGENSQLFLQKSSII